jgi:hypothetical protein
MKDGLPRFEKVVIGGALVEARALFIDCEIHNARHCRNYVETVFETNLHSICRGILVQEIHVVYEVGVLQVQAIVILIAIGVIRI